MARFTLNPEYPMETWLERQEIYRGRIVTLETGRVRLDNGKEVPREVLRHPGAVAVVPFQDDTVTFVKQYRVAIEQETVEIPAGKLEGDEDPERRGVIELEEETGLVPNRVVPVGHVYPSCGIIDEIMYLYLAFDLTRKTQSLQDDEQIEVVEMSLDEVRAALADHRFVDAKTVVGLHRLLAYIDAQR